MPQSYENTCINAFGTSVAAMKPVPGNPELLFTTIAESGGSRFSRQKD